MDEKRNILTKNFTFEELCHSATAESKGIKNVPETKVKEAMVRDNLTALCEHVLQPLRDHLGKEVFINSGFRTAIVNRMVGGKVTSQHLWGEAADIRIESAAQGCQWAKWIMDNCRFDQMLLERSGDAVWLHVSHKLTDHLNRQQFKQLVIINK